MMEVDDNEDKDPVEAPVLQMYRYRYRLHAIVMKIREDPPV